MVRIPKLNKTSVIAAIKKFNGNVRAASESLNVYHPTFYKFIADNPEIEDILIEARKGFVIQRQDAAEFVLDYMINQKSTLPRLAYDTAKYILETHGKKRGYSKSKEEGEATPSRDIIIELENKIMDLEAQVKEQKKINMKRCPHCSSQDSETKDVMHEEDSLSETYYEREAEPEFPGSDSPF